LCWKEAACHGRKIKSHFTGRHVRKGTVVRKSGSGKKKKDGNIANGKKAPRGVSQEKSGSEKAQTMREICQNFKRGKGSASEENPKFTVYMGRGSML